LQLSVDGCGQYKFKIQTTNYDNTVNPPTTCTSVDTLTINIETAKTVRAGADQVKCPSEPIGLNGNDPYCNAIGTWTQIHCSNLNYYQVTIDDIHNPSTQLTIKAPNDTICPPDTLCFVWSFASEGDCDLSDTTRIIIRDSCCYVEPCAQNIHVISECSQNHAILTVTSDQGVLNPNEYTIIWTPGGQGNPINLNLPPNGTVYYSVEVYKIVDGDTLCHTVLPGFVHCPEIGCGAHVVESCDQCGNVILTLVDAQTGNIIPPTTYLHEINWHIYGGGAGSLGFYTSTQNPVVIQQDAHYALNYQHYVYPPNVPNVPGYQTSICVFNIPKTPVSITCPGPCENFNDFFIAGCGDNLDISLNLDFPPGCQSFCGSQGTAGTLGVFHKSNNMPVNAALFTIKWKY
jgi:hypothetical protein